MAAMDFEKHRNRCGMATPGFARRLDPAYGSDGGVG